MIVQGDFGKVIDGVRRNYVFKRVNGKFQVTIMYHLKEAGHVEECINPHLDRGNFGL